MEIFRKTASFRRYLLQKRGSIRNGKHGRGVLKPAVLLGITLGMLAGG